MTRSRAQRRAPLLHKVHVRTRRAARARPTPPAGPPADGVGLTRLLAVARLTPPQAVALGADLVAAVEARPVAAPPRLAAVRVGRDGAVRLLDGPPGHGSHLAQVGALLDRLAAATDGPVPALDRAAAEARSPDGRLAIVAAVLREADAPGGRRARAELGRAVAVIVGAPAPAPSAAPRSAAPRRRPPRRPRRTPARAVAARSWKWALSVMVLVVVVAAEITFLRDDIARDVTAVLQAGRAGATAASPSTALPPLPTASPPSGGTVDAVDLRPVAPCAPGAECALRVQVRVRPQAQPYELAFSLRVLDRCTRVLTAAPGSAATVPPYGDRLDAVVTVSLPEASALAVTAVTDQPFTATSAAVPVPEDGACPA
ncbi:MAG TPA: hypothetical protein VKZ81_07635 [Pseudonocardia sp.]|uniref:hypothetical protein n=1 Tax=Pseudonocardia sp. TaxID=60912 RepID=UPI002B4AD0A3|nr:hypothetical protein [Pseudonocardia sp.]HLU55319.1 hypothetical protein [Pseudonocardia sp.]